MNIIRDHKVKVLNIDEYRKLPRKEWYEGGATGAWCEIHDQYYVECKCPKFGNTPKKGGWLIEFDKDGEAYGYPTKEIYLEYAMWIDRKLDKMICSICGIETQVNADNVHLIDEIVAEFFDIHIMCGVKKHMSQIEAQAREPD
jgi:hypothetical protein